MRELSTQYPVDFYQHAIVCIQFFIISETNYKGWREGMDICKTFETYLPGNITLSNATSACMGFGNIGPRWIGVVKESRENTDKGKLKKKTNHLHLEPHIVQFVFFWCDFKPVWREKYHMSQQY